MPDFLSKIHLAWFSFLGSGQARVLKRAKIVDLRLHDLRRSMASWMANSGANASVIQGALNHKDIKTTMLVYAHTAKNVERDAKARAQQTLLKGSKRRLNVVPFERKELPKS